MKSWEELTALEQAACIYSDMYKDAYGIRPRNDTSNWTLEQFEHEFKHLTVTINREESERKLNEAIAVKNFEQHVTNTICMGAKDRDTALCWIMDASEAGGDWEYFCFLNGLPYGYFKKAA